MALMTIRPTAADREIANAIAARTTPELECAAQLLTWGADEKMLLAAAIGAWLYARRRPSLRPITNHMLAVSIFTAALPHVLKKGVDQIRPDRLTVKGHWRGVPMSGRPRDAFPSGHALHMGALASAAGLLPPRQRRAARALAVALSATRVILLAHWMTDVAAGFAAGVLIERLLRPLTLGSAEIAGNRRDMTEYLARFVIGGLAVSAFAMLGDMLRPKSFAGLFGAAPSVALATLGIALWQHGAGYAAEQSRAMIWGAVALFVYSIVVCQLLMRRRWNALPATLAALTVWFCVALGLHVLSGAGA